MIFVGSINIVANKKKNDRLAQLLASKQIVPVSEEKGIKQSD